MDKLVAVAFWVSKGRVRPVPVHVWVVLPETLYPAIAAIDSGSLLSRLYQGWLPK